MNPHKRPAVRVAWLVVGVSLLLFAGAIVASNMGFKITKSLVGAGVSPQGDPSESGTNYFALPAGFKAGLVTAKDLFIDINASPGGSLQFINKHRPVDDGFEVYTYGGGTIPPSGWDLEAGVGYILKVGSTFDYVVAGAGGDETFEFVGAGGSPAGLSASGTNYYAPPYHGVAANARELFKEIGGQIQFINKHRRADDGFEVYSFGGGTLPPNGWTIVHGEAYIIKIGGTSQSYTPLHY